MQKTSGNYIEAYLLILLSQVLLVAPHVVGQTRSVPLELPLMSAYGDTGTVTFRETMKGGLNIDVQLHSFQRGEYAVQIHEYPTCVAPDFKAAGAHFNPGSKQHGWANPNGHHAGDLPENIVVDSHGDGHMNVTVKGLNMIPGSTYSIMDHSVVIHERPDDMKTDPTGNSGNRIACAVIPLKK